MKGEHRSAELIRNKADAVTVVRVHGVVSDDVLIGVHEIDAGLIRVCGVAIRGCVIKDGVTV